MKKNRKSKVWLVESFFHIFCQVASSSSDEHQYEEESDQFTKFQLETLKAHNELRFVLSERFCNKIFFWHHSGQNMACLQWSSVERHETYPLYPTPRIALSNMTPKSTALYLTNAMIINIIVQMKIMMTVIICVRYDHHHHDGNHHSCTM